MLRNNLDKAFVVPSLPYQIASADQPLPADWLYLLGNELIKHRNLQAAAAKAIHTQLNQHAGEASTFPNKKDLLTVLARLYLTLIDPKTLPFQQASIAMRLVEGLAECAQGFHTRCLMCTNTAQPANLDELLSLVRQDLVERTAAQNTNEVHTHNRFFSVANRRNFGVRAVNKEDIYPGDISYDVIERKLKAAFDTHYRPIAILNALLDRLRGLMSDRGYVGRVEAGYNEIYHQFSAAFLQPFIGEIDSLALFERIEDDDNDIYQVLDINWLVVKRALLHTIDQQAIFFMSDEEKTTYQSLLSNEIPKAPITPLTCSKVGVCLPMDDLIQLMTFLGEWPATHKAAHVLAHLRQQPVPQHRAILEKLFDQHPSLLPILKTVTELDINEHVNAYLPTQLKQAATSGELARLLPLVEQGISLSLAPVLAQLMDPVNKAVFMDTPALRQHLTVNDFRETITEGKYQGKTLAAVWIESRRGRYCLSQDESLRARMTEALGVDKLNVLLKEAEQTKPLPHGKLFAPASANIKTFLQHIARGEQAQAEAMLNTASPAQKRALLTGKVIVRDYADETGRLLKGTALQLALGAEDVKYHDDEEAMTEMLIKHLKGEADGEALITQQIQAQFPKGFEAAEKARADRDDLAIKKVFDDIDAAETDEPITDAVNVFKTYLARENKGEDGNKVFKQGKYFNMGLYIKALDLYDEYYNRNGRNSINANKICWRKVIGSIQRYLSTPHMQATAQGIYYIVVEGRNGWQGGGGDRYVHYEGKESLKRSMRLSYEKLPYFSHICHGHRLHLGVDYAAGGDSTDEGRAMKSGSQSRFPFSRAGDAAKLMSGKNRKLRELMLSRSAFLQEMIESLPSAELKLQYSKFVTEAENKVEALKNNIISVLNNYNNPRGGLLFSFHWNRHHRPEVKQLITQIKETNTPEQLREALLTQFTACSKVGTFNLNGSFARRLQYLIGLTTESIVNSLKPEASPEPKNH